MIFWAYIEVCSGLRNIVAGMRAVVGLPPCFADPFLTFFIMPLEDYRVFEESGLVTIVLLNKCDVRPRARALD